MHLAVSRKSSPWIAFLLCVCAAEAGIPEAAAPREIRVKETPGGPQIHVDGKAVPPRMVYVRDQPLQCPLRPWWTEYRFSFVPKEDADIATLRMRFHMRAGSRALLRNFKMAEDGSPFAPWLAGAFEEESAFSASWRVEPEDRTYRRFVTGGVCEVALHPTRQAPVPDYRFRSRPMRLRKGVEYAVSFEALGVSLWFVFP